MTNEIWNREELYAEIWDKPLVKVAAKYGISAVALGKVCRKLQIPLPGRGYWVKKEFGKPVEHIPLPEAHDLPVVRRIKGVSGESGSAESGPADPELERIATVEATNVAFDPDAKLHKLVIAAKRALKSVQTDDRGILVPPHNEQCLNIRVSKSSLNRALQLINAIILKLENDGLVVDVRNDRDSTGVTAYGHRVTFCIVERVRVKNKREVKEYSWTRTVFDHEPTGELEFRVIGYGHNIRRTWSDGKTRRLETLLSRCIGALMREARLKQIDAEVFKQREIERQRRQEERAELARQIEEEEKKIQNLDVWVTNWVRAEQMRTFIVALERLWIEKGHDLSPTAPKGQRIIWMKQQADRLDPMFEGPPSIVDRKGELRMY